MADPHIAQADLSAREHADLRAQERQCRVPRALPARGGIAARVRAVEAHRDAVARRADVPRRIAVSLALPHGGTRLDRGAMGRARRAATPALLLDHARRAHDARGATKELEGVRLR